MGAEPITRIAAGGVLVRRSRGHYEVCLTLRQRHGPAWGLPKGHLESGEETAAAALREVREETGVTGVILESLGSIRYQFITPDQAAPVQKMVHFYLMGADTDRLDPHDRETVEARWVTIDAAMAAVGHDNEHPLLEPPTHTLAPP